MEAYTDQEHARAPDRLAGDMEAGRGGHTPGPWAEFNRDGSRIFKQWGVHGANGNRVCWVENNPECGRDARLIAAAPDLAEALNGLVDHYKSVNLQGVPAVWPLFDAARAALAKAGY